MTGMCERMRMIRSGATYHYSWQLGIACLLIAGAGCSSKSGSIDGDKPRLVPVKVGDDVRLTNLDPLNGWGEDRDCTFMHCLETALAGVGRPIGYDELMGLSGMAFRTQFRVGIWDGSNPDPLVGEACLPPLMSAIGYDAETIIPRKNDAADAARVRTAVAGSLDRGAPVLATNLIPPENWGIITGYLNHGSQWWCRTYDAGSFDVPATGWPTAVVILTKALPRPSAKAAHRASIARAIELHDKAIVETFAQGGKAFDEWEQMLERVTDRDYMQPNAWTYVSLIDARGAAVRYLRSIAPEFGKQRNLIEQAAESYERQRELLRNGLPAVQWPQDFPRGVPPFATRQRQIAVLREAAILDDEAIDALRKIK